MRYNFENKIMNVKINKILKVNYIQIYGVQRKINNYLYKKVYKRNNISLYS